MSEQNYSKILCEKITELRKKQGVTQETLAQKLGITFQAVSKWENLISCPDISLLPKLADIFRVSVDELFGNTIESQPCCNLPWNDDDKLRVVVCRGKKVLESSNEISREFKFTYIGEALNIESYCAINCKTIEGDASCIGSVNCETIEGNVSCNGNVTSETIDGDVACNGSVKCETIEGNVTCDGNIKCETISGDAKTDKGDIKCHTIEGNVTCTGNIKCSNIED